MKILIVGISVHSMWENPTWLDDPHKWKILISGILHNWKFFITGSPS
jgi:hypothetical protein